MAAPTQFTSTDRLHAYAKSVDVLVARWLDTVALSARASLLEERAHQSVTLRQDLARVDTILNRLVADITANAVTLKAHCDLEAESGEELEERAHKMSRTHCRWVDYAAARIGAAEVMHDALG